MKPGNTLEVRACLKEAINELGYYVSGNWTDPLKYSLYVTDERVVTMRIGGNPELLKIAVLANQKLADAGFINRVRITTGHVEYIKVNAYLPFTVTVDKNGLMHS